MFQIIGKDGTIHTAYGAFPDEDGDLQFVLADGDGNFYTTNSYGGFYKLYKEESTCSHGK